jgi:hypothetical protein
METVNTTAVEKMVQSESIDTVKASRECPVCGMDEWCGTDGCPMDPK